MSKEMSALMDLMEDKKLYFKKDGKLVSHELPDYGVTSLVSMDEKVVRIEDNIKRTL